MSPLDHQIRDALDKVPHFLGWKLRFEACEVGSRLKGVVRSYYQKQMAQESLREVAGVDLIETSWK